MSREVQVDLGETGILVLQFKDVLTPERREKVRQVMETVATQSGRQTLVLEDGCEYSVIPRDKA